MGRPGGVPMSINYDTCCPAILAELASVSDDVADVPPWVDDTADQVLDDTFPWLGLINDLPGRWVYSAPNYFPSLAELVQRITSFGFGFATWSFFASRSSRLDILNRVEYCLPAAPGPSRVVLNGAQMEPILDYTLVGSSLFLTHPLEYEDLLTVKSYGAPP